MCHIVEYSADDARINEPFEEAMLLARHKRLMELEKNIKDRLKLG
jgi:hypothetical protein